MDPPHEIAALEEHLKLMSKIATMVEALVSNGRLSSLQSAAGKFYRTEAEYWLARAKAR